MARFGYNRSSSRDQREFTVYMNEGEKYQIEEWVKKYPNIETGGDLFGAWIDDRTAVVQFVLGPGENCRRTSVSFFQKIEYLRDAGNYLTQQHGLCNIGQWHSHHQLGLTQPSGGDRNTVWGNMPNLGLNRYIVFIATITDNSYNRSYFNYDQPRSYCKGRKDNLTVKINPYLFEIKPDGRRNDVLHGYVKDLKGNSPFRLDEAIQVTVTVGAETTNNVASYKEISAEEKRKRPHNETGKGRTEPESKQSKSKAKEEGKSNLEKSTTNRSTSQAKGSETTTGTASNTTTLKLQANYSSTKRVQEISSLDEVMMIDQAEKDTATLNNTQSSSSGSRPERKSLTVDTEEGTEPTKECEGDEEMKSMTEKLDDSRTPETSTRGNNLDMSLEHSIQTVQVNNSLDDETIDEANKDTPTSVDNQNSLEKGSGPESPTTGTAEGTEPTEEREGNEEMKSKTEELDDGKTPETSTQNKNLDITFQHSKETEKEDGSTTKQAIKESGNRRENDEAMDVNTSECTEPTVECVQEQQNEQRAEGSENGISPETLTQKKEDRNSSHDERNFTVYMNEGERYQIEEWVKKYPNIETGGDLFGAWIDDRTAVVQFVLGPGKKVYRTTGSFYQDIDYLGDAGSYLTQQHGLCNIGQWHSHQSSTRPSGGDENTVWGNMPNLGLNRYIVIIATITSSSRSYCGENYGSSYPSAYSDDEGITVHINPYLFEIKDGRKNDVLHGSFHYMTHNSPFRLDKGIHVKVAVGAETINNVASYKGISAEEKKDRKRPHNETEEGPAEPESKQSKSKVEGKSSNPQAVTSSLDKSTTTRSTSQAKEAIDETAVIESNTFTTQPHHHSTEAVQVNSSMDEKMIDQAETDDNQSTSLESTREVQSSGSEMRKGTEPMERLGGEQFKPIVQNQNESRAPPTHKDNFGVPLEDSQTEKKEDGSMQNIVTNDSGNHETGEDLHPNHTESTVEYFQDKQQQQVEASENEQLPEISTHKKEDGTPQVDEIDESRNPQQNESAQVDDVDMREHTEPNEEYFRDKQTEQQVGDSENGKTLERSQPNDAFEALKHLPRSEETGEKDDSFSKDTELAEKKLEQKQNKQQIDDVVNEKSTQKEEQAMDESVYPEKDGVQANDVEMGEHTESGNHKTEEDAQPNDVNITGEAGRAEEHLQDKRKMEESENGKTPETSTQKKDDDALQDLTKKEETGSREIDEGAQPNNFDMNGQTEFGVEHQFKQKEQPMPKNKQSPEPPTQKGRLNISDGLDRENSAKNTVLNASNPEDNPNHTETEGMEVNNDHFSPKSGAIEVQQERFDKNPQSIDACKKGKTMEDPDQDTSNEIPVENMDSYNEHESSKDGAANVGQDTLDDKESASKQSGDGGKELDIVVRNEESSDCAQLRTAIPLPSSSQKEDSYVKKEEGNSKEEKKGSVELQGISDVTEQTEGNTNISPYLHQDDQSFAKPVKDGERLGGGIDDLSEQNKAILEDNEHNIEELGSEHLLTNSKTGEHIEERKEQLIGKSHNQATPSSELIKETNYLMKSIKKDMQDNLDNEMKARDGQTDDKLNKKKQMPNIEPEEIADSDAVDLETQYHDENRSKTKEGQEDNKLNIKIPLPNVTREEMKDSNTNQEIEEPLKSIGVNLQTQGDNENESKIMDGLNKTNKISGEMNDSNKNDDLEEPVEKIVVDSEEIIPNDGPTDKLNDNIEVIEKPVKSNGEDLETGDGDKNENKTMNAQTENTSSQNVLAFKDAKECLSDKNITEEFSDEMADQNEDNSHANDVEVPTIGSITETNANKDSKELTNQINVSTECHLVAGAAYNDNHGKLPTERSERDGSIFAPLLDYQRKEETNKAEETVADKIIKADAMTHTYTATETKKEGTDSQYEETMVASEEVTTNAVIQPLDGVDSTEMKNKRRGEWRISCLPCRRSKKKNKGESKKVKQKSKGIEDSRLEESTDSAANRKEAEKGTTQEKKSIGGKQGRNINQSNMSVETSL